MNTEHCEVHKIPTFSTKNPNIIKCGKIGSYTKHHYSGSSGQKGVYFELPLKDYTVSYKEYDKVKVKVSWINPVKDRSIFIYANLESKQWFYYKGHYYKFDPCIYENRPGSKYIELVSYYKPSIELWYTKMNKNKHIGNNIELTYFDYPREHMNMCFHITYITSSDDPYFSGNTSESWDKYLENNTVDIAIDYLAFYD